MLAAFGGPAGLHDMIDDGEYGFADIGGSLNNCGLVVADQRCVGVTKFDALLVHHAGECLADGCHAGGMRHEGCRFFQFLQGEFGEIGHEQTEAFPDAHTHIQVYLMIGVYLVQFHVLRAVGVFQGCERVLKRVRPA